MTFSSRRKYKISFFPRRLLAEMEQQIVELQREYDESKEECLGHQKVIQELKGSLDQVKTYSF